MLVPMHASDTSGWLPVEVPGPVEADGNFRWYRCRVSVPADWEGSRLLLEAGRVSEVDEAYFNGERIGASGSMPPLFSLPASRVRRPYVIEPDRIRFGESNLIAWRIYHRGGGGAIVEGPVRLSRPEDAIDLSGAWLARAGDRPGWADPLPALTGGRVEGRIVPVDSGRRREALESVRRSFEGNTNVHALTEGKGEPLDPGEALSSFVLREGLALDLVLHEPLVRQPLYVDFDARGRLWVVQYLQYPDPAGLETLAWDSHLRRVYDRVPPPPPHRGEDGARFAGRDRITHHEDSDGDGIYDRHGVFVEGLSLATSLAFDREGLWVLQPPYLLFYPDRDRDDRPDGDPEVHLSGFGLEDTHSIANSLKWGPDGWLYGVTGSTVTARVRVRSDGPPHVFLGQAVWRYHPDAHRFELFSEGGWNNFGLEFDARGRIFSGTNGNLQAVRFRQGAYYRKSFGKHGPFTRSHTFGHFDGLPIEGSRIRLVHQWVPYSSGAVPQLEGRLVGGNALGHRIHALRLLPEGSSFRTVEEPLPLRSTDRWFRPVHLAIGPGGTLHVADWYDARITHLDPRDNWDTERGRIYRLRAEGQAVGAPPDLDRLSSAALVERLGEADQWQRRSARRLLRERGDASVVPRLLAGLEEGGTFALECLWVLHALGGPDEAVALRLLEHGEAALRGWCLRLLCDPGNPLPPALLSGVMRQVEGETDPEVLAQAASGIRRLPPRQALPLLRILMAGDSAAGDPDIPLLCWWALEEQIRRDAQAVLASLSDPGMWSLPLFRAHGIERLGRRFMAERSESNLEACARLLQLAPDDQALSALVRGMAAGTEGNPVDSPPPVLEEALATLRKAFPGDGEIATLALGLGSPSGPEAARDLVRRTDLEPGERRLLLRGLLARRDPGTLSLLLSLVRDSSDPLRSEALGGLRHYGEDRVAGVLLKEMARTREEVWQQALASVLTGRRSWARRLEEAIDRGTVVPLPGVHPLPEAAGDPSPGSLRRVREALAGGAGDAGRGRTLYAALCGPCHRLFDVGRRVGPDLTGYERDNTEFLLTAILDPGLAVREEYEWVTLTLRTKPDEEAARASGFLTGEEEDFLTLRDLAGNDVRLARRDVIDRERSPISVMPEGLLEGLDAAGIRDLFAFLQRPSE